MTALVFSPHLDDAVLSASLAIASHVARGERVVVATVFSEGRGAPERRREDVAALAELGAEALHLGLLDAPDRRGVPAAFRSLCLERDEQVERAECTLVARAVRAVIAAECPTRCYFPLAVGGHVDHRLVCAAHAVATQAAFYEDMPYAAVLGWVGDRLGAPNTTSDARFAEGLRATLGQLLDGDDDVRAAVAARPDAAQHPRLPPLELVTIAPEAVHVVRRTAAVLRYRSQLGALFPGGDPGAVYGRARACGERVWLRG